VADHGFDPDVLFGDRAGELDERREPASSGPGEHASSRAIAWSSGTR